MLNLPMEHPEVYEHLKNGVMIANTFGRIPVDQAIEEAANNDPQTAEVGGHEIIQFKPWSRKQTLPNSRV